MHNSTDNLQDSVETTVSKTSLIIWTVICSVGRTFEFAVAVNSLPGNITKQPMEADRTKLSAPPLLPVIVGGGGRARSSTRTLTGSSMLIVTARSELRKFLLFLAPSICGFFVCV